MSQGVKTCRLNFLSPLPNIEDLLTQQQQRQKDKAEKTAKNIINNSVKQNLKAKEKELKESKKRKKGKKENIEPDQPDQDPAGAREKAQEIIQKAEEDQDKLDSVLQEHLDRFKLPDYIPLTKLSTTDERMVKSTRGLLMQAAIDEAEACLARDKAAKSRGEKADAPVGPVKLGIAAALGAMEQGSGAKFGKVKKPKDSVEDKDVVTKELMKMGKHLLK